MTVKFAIENEKVDLNENQICPISEKFTGLRQEPDYWGTLMHNANIPLFDLYILALT